MNSKEHLLICLMEEAAEVQKAASKLLRFGPCEYSPVDPAMVTNREALAQEIYDFTDMVELLLKEGIIAEHPNEGWMNAHRASYNQHLGIAYKIGTVKDEGMKEYGAWDADFGTHTVRVTLQHANLRGSFTYKRKGNCKGIQLLDFDPTEHDASMLEFEPGLEIAISRGNSWEVNFLAPEGHWVTFYPTRMEIEQMIVGIEIVDFKGEE